MSFTVTNNLTIRKDYGDNQKFVKKANRTEVSNATLTFADSSALRKAIRALQTSAYNTDEDLSESTGPAKEYAKKMKAFVDTYNYTLESAGKGDSKGMKNAAKKLKRLTSQYEDELSDAGIRLKKDGSMEISSSSTVKSTARYEKMFGSDSKYLKNLDSLASQIRKHVDVQL